MKAPTVSLFFTEKTWSTPSVSPTTTFCLVRFPRGRSFIEPLYAGALWSTSFLYSVTSEPSISVLLCGAVSLSLSLARSRSGVLRFWWIRAPVARPSHASHRHTPLALRHDIKGGTFGGGRSAHLGGGLRPVPSRNRKPAAFSFSFRFHPRRRAGKLAERKARLVFDERRKKKLVLYDS